MFQKLNYSLLRHSTERAGITPQVEAAQGLVATERVMQELFGMDVCQFIRPAYIRERTLCIVVTHPAVAERIQTNTEAIIFGVNNLLGRPEIIHIRFILPTNQT